MRKRQGRRKKKGSDGQLCKGEKHLVHFVLSTYSIKLNDIPSRVPGAHLGSG